MDKQWLDLGKELGLTGQELFDFVKEREDAAREDRAAAREDRQKQLEILDKQIALEKAKKENQSVRTDLHSNESHHSSTKFPKLPHFVDGKDNMDAYLERFERYASSQKWPPSTWAINLGALLQGRALDVYSRLSPEEAGNYSELKQALLKRFQMSAEDFQHKFRTAEPEPGETARQYAVRLEHYFDRWLDLTSTPKTYDSLKDLVIRQQFLKQCGSGMSVFLKERTPKSVKEVTEMAEVYVAAHGGHFKVPRKNPRQSMSDSSPVVDSRNEKSSFQKPVSSTPPSSDSTDRRPLGPCFHCGKLGHIAKYCWSKSRSHAGVGLVDGGSKQNDRQNRRKNKQNEEEDKEDSNCPTCSSHSSSTQTDRPESGMFLITASMESSRVKHRKVNVEARKCPQMCASCKEKLRSHMPVHDGSVGSQRVSVLHDTGCSGVVIRKALVKSHEMTGRLRQCVLIDGTVRRYPTAIVHIHTPFYNGDVEALCMESPVFDLIVGNVENAQPPKSSPKVGIHKSKVDVATETSVSESSHLGSPTSKVDVAVGTDVSMETIVCDAGMAMQTRAQSTEAKKSPRALKVPLPIPDVSPDDIRKAQQEDKTLEKIRSYAKSSPDSSGSDSHFFIENGLFYRKFEPKSVMAGNAVTQLVIPQPYRSLVLKLAHEGLMGGHQDSKKTCDKVLSNFYWPGVSADVTRFCQSCDICQRTVSRGRVPLSLVYPT